METKYSHVWQPLDGGNSINLRAQIIILGVHI